MIDEKTLSELREHWERYPDKNNANFSNAIYVDMMDTIEALWKIARMAEVFQEAMLNRYARHNHDDPSKCDTCFLSGKLLQVLNVAKGGG